MKAIADRGGVSRSAALLPALVLVTAVVIVPMIRVAVDSFSGSGSPWHNYSEFFATPTFVTTFIRTVLTSAVISVLCAVIAYPYAYCMTLLGTLGRNILFACVLIPFWTSAVARTFSWLVLLEPNGVLDNFEHAIGLGQSTLLNTQSGVTLAMIQVMLPIMVMILYPGLAGIDRRLLKAAANLGAGPIRAWWNAYFPLSRPALLSGIGIVYVSSLGFYLIPQVLGSPSQMLLSQLMFQQVTQLLHINLGSAMAMIMLATTAVVLFLTARLGRGSRSAAPTPHATGVTGGIGSSRRPVGLIAFAVIVSIFLLVPTLIMVPISFSANDTFALPTSGFSLQWYRSFFGDPTWTAALWSSLRIAIATTVAATVIGVAAAMSIARSRLRPVRALGSAIQIPRGVPSVILGLAIYAAFLQWNLTGTYTGFILAHTALAVPYVVVSVLVSARSIDERVERAAASLGANPIQRFVTVTLPLIAPSVISGAVIAFSVSFDETLVSVFLQTPYLQTLPVVMYSSIQDNISPTIAAAASMTLIIALAATAISIMPSLRRKR